MTKKEVHRILVVDDDPFILNYFQFLLRPPRYQVEVAEDAESALEKTVKIRPDLVISDVVLPGMSGYDLCKAIRSIPELENIIFILTSSELTEEKDATKGLTAGADDYLMKPYNNEQTKAKIDSFLRIKKLQDDLVRSNRELSATVRELEQHKKLLEETNRILEQDKQRLRNSLREISYLTDELEKSHRRQVELNHTLKKNFDDLVTLLSTIVEHRNPYFKGHSQKVAEASLFIAKALGLDEKEIRNIEIAALLHEIGKIGIPDEIISKHPDDYTDQERLIVQQHPLVGESLLKGYSGLEGAARIIRHLHENVDGSGYPDGLAGDKIPIGSRIIKLASCFDKMTYNAEESGQIYRAVEALALQADVEYDALLVQYLKKYVDTFADRRKKRRTGVVNIIDLKEGMVLSKDLYTSTGIKLIPKDTKLTSSSIKCIMNYNKTDPLKEGISIYIQ
jgi:response regulator RpfG family c-di-GMP phosphodiesterase